MIVNHRVIFGDTDQMGVVYYANYFRYFEAARAEYMRRIEMSSRVMEPLGVGFPVIEAHCNYKRPAHYEDELAIELHITKLTGVTARFEYEVRREETLLATGHTTHACVGETGRPAPLPAILRAAIEKQEAAD